MKKNVVVMVVMVVGMAFAGINAYAQGCCGSGGGYGAQKGWGSDPATDPVYKQFLEDSEEIRKEIDMDRAELNAVMSSENPDKELAKEIAGRLMENKQKLVALKIDSGFGGPGAGGGCGSCGGYKRGCGGGPNAYDGPRGGYGYGGCGSCGGPAPVPDAAE